MWRRTTTPVHSEAGSLAESDFSRAAEYNVTGESVRLDTWKLSEPKAGAEAEHATERSGRTSEMLQETELGNAE